MLIRAALARLFFTLVFAQGSFALYWAALPLYFAALGFNPTLIGLLIASAGIAELAGALIVGPAIDRLGSRALRGAHQQQSGQGAHPAMIGSRAGAALRRRAATAAMR